MYQQKTQRLGHGPDYKAGLQPSADWAPRTWGVAPGWYKPAPSALFAISTCLFLSACNSTAPPPKPISTTPAYTYPARPTIPPPAFKVFHQDEDTYTLTTDPNATDPQIEAILWQFRDAAHAHTFAALHLDQKFIDARKPSIWFHVYRGPKCANEKFTTGKYPCGAKYNGAGDYTLGAYNNPQWDDAVLHHPDGTETHLWNSEAPYIPPSPKP